MQPPSWILFFVIVISGVIAVAANAWYPVVKAREERAELASNAKAILLLEFKRNSEFVSTIHASLVKGELYLEQFDVTACETISKGGLLLGLEPPETTNFCVFAVSPVKQTIRVPKS
jgi:hypothetical protein